MKKLSLKEYRIEKDEISNKKTLFLYVHVIDRISFLGETQMLEKNILIKEEGNLSPFTFNPKFYYDFGGCRSTEVTGKIYNWCRSMRDLILNKNI